MKVDRAKLERNLPKKGFVRDHQGHHIYFHHMVAGRYTGAYTFVSHSPKFRDIGNTVISVMRGQLRLDTNKEVADLAHCPMDGAQYTSKLRSKGVIP